LTLNSPNRAPHTTYSSQRIVNKFESGKRIKLQIKGLTAN